jgi:hypothetical protein
MPRTFELSERQEQWLQDWLQNTIYPKYLEMQKEQMSAEEYSDLTLDGKYPYLGATGGGVEYVFTPNSIGVGVHVRFVPTGEELNLTEYDLW